MNLRLRHSIHCAAAIALLALLCPSSAHAVGWTFQSVKSSFSGLPGATGDGVTDDTAAINRAIAALSIVYFPPGTYKYTGSMALPANKSYRIYGDGPGVSTILFTGNPNAGIYGPNIGSNTLNVEGLTLKANSNNCGTAIYAVFGPNGPNNVKYHHATIHNIQILGSARDGVTGTYWTAGVYLYKAQDSFIDKVEISGNKNVTQTGIFWESAPDTSGGNADASTGMTMTNIQIKYCNIGLRTAGWVEGLYVNGFEIVSCGRTGLPAVLLSKTNGGAFQLHNGLVDSVGSGVEMTNPILSKVSNVRFRHTGAEVANGTMLYLNGGWDVMVTECSFYGVDNNAVAAENGIFLDNAHSIRLTGNNFNHMLPVNGNCIVVLSGSSTVVRITDNLFSNVRGQYYDGNPDPNDPYYSGNNP